MSRDKSNKIPLNYFFIVYKSQILVKNNNVDDHTNPSPPLTSPPLVCKLKKSLYGLKQAPRQWFSKLSHTLQTFGYPQFKSDYSHFFEFNQDKFTLVLIYVDDFLISRNSLSEIHELKILLSTSFHMKDLGPLRYFLC